MTSPAAALLDAACNESDEAFVPLWLVGGAVRDLALGHPAHDLDLALAEDAAPFAARLVARLRDAGYCDVEVESEPRFGTASIRLAGDTHARLDLARLRQEHYVAPGALPVVEFTGDIEADLARRDFSVNAMALGLAGGVPDVLVDPFEGIADLAARRLRVLHARSFEDDATRLWRGARTAAVFDLAPDAPTARLIAHGTRYLDTVSGKRISAELGFTARRGRAGRTLALAEAWGVLRGTHPALRLDASTARALRHRAAPLPFEVFMAVLLAPLAERAPILERLSAPRVVATAVEQTARLLAAATGGVATPETLASLDGASEAARTAARWLAPDTQRAFQRDLARWERTRPVLDAAALMRLGVPQGPRLGAALDGLRRARYLGTLVTRTAAEREVRRVIEAGGDAGW